MLNTAGTQVNMYYTRIYKIYTYTKIKLVIGLESLKQNVF